MRCCLTPGGVVAAVLAALLYPPTADAVERIVFRPHADSDATREVVGEALITAADGGMLLLADDGQLWTVQPERVISRETDDQPLVPIERGEAAERLLAKLPPGFKVHMTPHYAICHNTTDEYVSWVAGLFEQIHHGFYTYWKNKGRELPEAEQPLIAVVFADQESFAQYASPEVGELVDSIIGYYNLQTNRMTTFYVNNPERRVATLVHEAVHQLAYNSGLQRRMVDNPYWVSEGLALYFESPDLNSARGWRNIGAINTVNRDRFVAYLRQRPANSLETLIRDDERFRDPSQATAAYAEAWALNYFLLRARQKPYLEYLDALARGPLLADSDPQARVKVFEEAMGTDLQTLDRQFLLYIKRYVR